MGQPNMLDLLRDIKKKDPSLSLLQTFWTEQLWKEYIGGIKKEKNDESKFWSLQEEKSVLFALPEIYRLIFNLTPAAERATVKWDSIDSVDRTNVATFNSDELVVLLPQGESLQQEGGLQEYQSKKQMVIEELKLKDPRVFNSVILPYSLLLSCYFLLWTWICEYSWLLLEAQPLFSTLGKNKHELKRIKRSQFMSEFLVAFTNISEFDLFTSSNPSKSIESAENRFFQQLQELIFAFPAETLNYRLSDTILLLVIDSLIRLRYQLFFEADQISRLVDETQEHKINSNLFSKNRDYVFHLLLAMKKENSLEQNWNTVPSQDQTLLEPWKKTLDSIWKTWAHPVVLESDVLHMTDFLRESRDVYFRTLAETDHLVNQSLIKPPDTKETKTTPLAPRTPSVIDGKWFPSLFDDLLVTKSGIQWARQILKYFLDYYEKYFTAVENKEVDKMKSIRTIQTWAYHTKDYKEVLEKTYGSCRSLDEVGKVFGLPSEQLFIKLKTVSLTDIAIFFTAEVKSDAFPDPTKQPHIKEIKKEDFEEKDLWHSVWSDWEDNTINLKNGTSLFQEEIKKWNENQTASSSSSTRSTSSSSRSSSSSSTRSTSSTSSTSSSISPSGLRNMLDGGGSSRSRRNRMRNPRNRRRNPRNPNAITLGRLIRSSSNSSSNSSDSNSSSSSSASSSDSSSSSSSASSSLSPSSFPEPQTSSSVDIVSSHAEFLKAARLLWSAREHQEFTQDYLNKSSTIPSFPPFIKKLILVALGLQRMNTSQVKPNSVLKSYDYLLPNHRAWEKALKTFAEKSANGVENVLLPFAFSSEQQIKELCTYSHSDQLLQEVKSESLKSPSYQSVQSVSSTTPLSTQNPRLQLDIQITIKQVVFVLLSMVQNVVNANLTSSSTSSYEGLFQLSSSAIGAGSIQKLCLLLAVLKSLTTIRGTSFENEYTDFYFSFAEKFENNSAPSAASSSSSSSSFSSSSSSSSSSTSVVSARSNLFSSSRQSSASSSPQSQSSSTSSTAKERWEFDVMAETISSLFSKSRILNSHFKNSEKYLESLGNLDLRKKIILFATDQSILAANSLPTFSKDQPSTNSQKDIEEKLKSTLCEKKKDLPFLSSLFQFVDNKNVPKVQVVATRPISIKNASCENVDQRKGLQIVEPLVLLHFLGNVVFQFFVRKYLTALSFPSLSSLPTPPSASTLSSSTLFSSPPASSFSFSQVAVPQDKKAIKAKTAQKLIDILQTGCLAIEEKDKKCDDLWVQDKLKDLKSVRTNSTDYNLTEVEYLFAASIVLLFYVGQKWATATSHVGFETTGLVESVSTDAPQHDINLEKYIEEASTLFSQVSDFDTYFLETLLRPGIFAFGGTPASLPTNLYYPVPDPGPLLIYKIQQREKSVLKVLPLPEDYQEDEGPWYRAWYRTWMSLFKSITELGKSIHFEVKESKLINETFFKDIKKEHLDTFRNFSTKHESNLSPFHSYLSKKITLIPDFHRFLILLFSLDEEREKLSGRRIKPWSHLYAYGTDEEKEEKEGAQIGFVRLADNPSVWWNKVMFENFEEKDNRDAMIEFLKTITKKAPNNVVPTVLLDWEKFFPDSFYAQQQFQKISPMFDTQQPKSDNAFRCSQSPANVLLPYPQHEEAKKTIEQKWKELRYTFFSRQIIENQAGTGTTAPTYPTTALVLFPFSVGCELSTMEANLKPNSLKILPYVHSFRLMRSIVGYWIVALSKQIAGGFPRYFEDLESKNQNFWKDSKLSSVQQQPPGEGLGYTRYRLFFVLRFLSEEADLVKETEGPQAEATRTSIYLHTAWIVLDYCYNMAFAGFPKFSDPKDNILFTKLDWMKDIWPYSKAMKEMMESAIDSQENKSFVEPVKFGGDPIAEATQVIFGYFSKPEKYKTWFNYKKQPMSPFLIEAIKAHQKKLVDQRFVKLISNRPFPTPSRSDLPTVVDTFPGAEVSLAAFPPYLETDITRVFRNYILSLVLMGKEVQQFLEKKATGLATAKGTKPAEDDFQWLSSSYPSYYVWACLSRFFFDVALETLKNEKDKKSAASAATGTGAAAGSAAAETDEKEDTFIPFQIKPLPVPVASTTTAKTVSLSTSTTSSSPNTIATTSTSTTSETVSSTTTTTTTTSTTTSTSTSAKTPSSTSTLTPKDITQKVMEDYASKLPFKRKIDFGKLQPDKQIEEIIKSGFQIEAEEEPQDISPSALLEKLTSREKTGLLHTQKNLFFGVPDTAPKENELTLSALLGFQPKFDAKTFKTDVSPSKTLNETAYFTEEGTEAHADSLPPFKKAIFYRKSSKKKRTEMNKSRWQKQTVEEPEGSSSALLQELGSAEKTNVSQIPKNLLFVVSDTVSPTEEDQIVLPALLGSQRKFDAKTFKTDVSSFNHYLVSFNQYRYMVQQLNKDDGDLKDKLPNLTAYLNKSKEVKKQTNWGECWETSFSASSSTENLSDVCNEQKMVFELLRKQAEEQKQSIRLFVLPEMRPASNYWSFLFDSQCFPDNSAAPSVADSSGSSSVSPAPSTTAPSTSSTSVSPASSTTTTTTTVPPASASASSASIPSAPSSSSTSSSQTQAPTLDALKHIFSSLHPEEGLLATYEYLRSLLFSKDSDMTHLIFESNADPEAAQKSARKNFDLFLEALGKQLKTLDEEKDYDPANTETKYVFKACANLKEVVGTLNQEVKVNNNVILFGNFWELMLFLASTLCILHWLVLNWKQSKCQPAPPRLPVSSVSSSPSSPSISLSPPIARKYSTPDGKEPHFFPQINFNIHPFSNMTEWWREWFVKLANKEAKIGLQNVWNKPVHSLMKHKVSDTLFPTFLAYKQLPLYFNPQVFATTVDRTKKWEKEIQKSDEKKETEQKTKDATITQLQEEKKKLEETNKKYQQEEKKRQEEKQIPKTAIQKNIDKVVKTDAKQLVVAAQRDVQTKLWTSFFEFGRNLSSWLEENSSTLDTLDKAMKEWWSDSKNVYPAFVVHYILNYIYFKFQPQIEADYPLNHDVVVLSSKIIGVDVFTQVFPNRVFDTLPNRASHLSQVALLPLTGAGLVQSESLPDQLFHPFFADKAIHQEKQLPETSSKEEKKGKNKGKKSKPPERKKQKKVGTIKPKEIPKRTKEEKKTSIQRPPQISSPALSEVVDQQSELLVNYDQLICTKTEEFLNSIQSPTAKIYALLYPLSFSIHYDLTSCDMASIPSPTGLGTAQRLSFSSLSILHACYFLLQPYVLHLLIGKQQTKKRNGKTQKTQKTHAALFYDYFETDSSAFLGYGEEVEMDSDSALSKAISAEQNLPHPSSWNKVKDVTVPEKYLTLALFALKWAVNYSVKIGVQVNRNKFNLPQLLDSKDVNREATLLRVLLLSHNCEGAIMEESWFGSDEANKQYSHPFIGADFLTPPLPENKFLTSIKGTCSDGQEAKKTLVASWNCGLHKCCHAPSKKRKKNYSLWEGFELQFLYTNVFNTLNLAKDNKDTKGIYVFMEVPSPFVTYFFSKNATSASILQPRSGTGDKSSAQLSWEAYLGQRIKRVVPLWAPDKYEGIYLPNISQEERTYKLEKKKEDKPKEKNFEATGVLVLWQTNIWKVLNRDLQWIETFAGWFSDGDAILKVKFVKEEATPTRELNLTILSSSLCLCKPSIDRLSDFSSSYGTFLPSVCYLGFPKAEFFLSSPSREARLKNDSIASVVEYVLEQIQFRGGIPVASVSSKPSFLRKEDFVAALAVFESTSAPARDGSVLDFRFLVPDKDRRVEFSYFPGVAEFVNPFSSSSSSSTSSGSDSNSGGPTASATFDFSNRQEKPIPYSLKSWRVLSQQEPVSSVFPKGGSQEKGKHEKDVSVLYVAHIGFLSLFQQVTSLLFVAPHPSLLPTIGESDTKKVLPSATTPTSGPTQVPPSTSESSEKVLVWSLPFSPLQPTENSNWDLLRQLSILKFATTSSVENYKLFFDQQNVIFYASPDVPFSIRTNEGQNPQQDIKDIKKNTYVENQKKPVFVLPQEFKNLQNQTFIRYLKQIYPPNTKVENKTRLQSDIYLFDNIPTTGERKMVNPTDALLEEDENWCRRFEASEILVTSFST